MIRILLLLLILGSCKLPHTNEPPPLDVRITAEDNNPTIGPNIRIVEISGCEYVIISRYSDFSGEVAITHKGNCKYCSDHEIQDDSETQE